MLNAGPSRCQAFELCRVSMTVYFQSRAGIKSNFSCLMQPKSCRRTTTHSEFEFRIATQWHHTVTQRTNMHCKNGEKKEEIICCCRFWAYRTQTVNSTDSKQTKRCAPTECASTLESSTQLAFNGRQKGTRSTAIVSRKRRRKTTTVTTPFAPVQVQCTAERRGGANETLD